MMPSWLRRPISHLPVPFHRAHHLLGHWKSKRNWITSEPQPDSPEPLGNLPLFAIVATWCEEDVIAATVRNAFAQGAERVYLVDNASTDATVERAVAAGAIVARRYETPRSNIVLRTQLVNSVMYEVSMDVGLPHIWWMVIDADEFPQGPGSATVKQYLTSLDRRFRVVGATFFNHYPTSKPEYLEGFHPMDFQPSCQEFWQPSIPRCRSRHWKHPLVRFDRDGDYLAPDEGTHFCRENDLTRPLAEPDPGIVIHHFPFRDEERTRRMLAVRFADNEDARHKIGSSAPGFTRFEAMDAVYAGRWKYVINGRFVKGGRGVTLRAWSEIAPGTEPPRWYSANDVDLALGAWRAASHSTIEKAQAP
jgi:hypothetical protein